MTGRVVRGMPEADYHAHESLSAGGAWLLAHECPAIYWHGSPFNPDAAPGEHAKPMDIGTAVHLAALEPDRRSERIVVVEADDWRTKAAKEARDGAYDAGLVPLLTKDVALVDGLDAALRADHDAAALLRGAETEVSYFWEADGVPCKARADLIARNGAIGDIKASASASPEFFQRRAFDAGHFLRVPWYRHGWQIAGGRRAPDYWFIVVAATAPHLVTVCKLDERAIAWGEMMVRRALTMFRRCRDRGEWPPYCTEPVTLSLPTWAEYRLADQEQEGAFDPKKIAAADVRRGFDFLAP